jgi:hypothetical protein
MALAMATLVRRKPSDIWYFRKAVPEALQNAIGYVEILRSLRVESDVAATYGEYLVEVLYLAIQCFPRYLDKEPNLVAQATAPHQDRKVLGISIFAMPQDD